MITKSEYESARQRAWDMLQQAGVPLSQAELDGMEVADFGLSELEVSGAQILTLADTDKIGIKLLVLFPGQTEPEHMHPRLGDYAGKEETIRCQWGELYLYEPGQASPSPRCAPPAHRRATYTVWHERILRPGDQLTHPPGTPHWFQAGPQGAVIWSISTKATDIADVFTDPTIVRKTHIVD
jgi:D-lyxose ketol-isomerase